ncbi:uncharacterized protein LOC121736264 [Aricia agestis]|uniref:uncharacterized protein LOC121736264 n=1 Tax=Aricia agestis TaxID=91739 RepID=UPI001C20A06C|nr:uncharacterized protein LOC121736264 [Aricia agestis]
MNEQQHNLMGAAPQASTSGFSPAMKKEDTELATISIGSRIPEFWKDNPRLWFYQVEAILAPQKTSDANKYFMCVAKLNKDAIQQVADILANPPQQNKYEALKNRLLQIYEESEARQVKKLISEIELGDQKPSQLLRRMKELARGKIEDETLKILWQGHLPSSVQAVLAVTSTSNLEELAGIADKIMDTHQPCNIGEVASGQQQPSSTSFEVAAIIAEIAKMNLKINQLEAQRDGVRSRSRSRSKPTGNYARERTQSRPRRAPGSPGWLCTYHWKYRGRAFRCEPPCSWENKREALVPRPEN